MTSDLGMGGIPFEYTVAAQSGAKVRFKRLLLILVYVVFTAASVIGIALSRLGAPFIALVPLVLWVLIFLTWRYTKIEYEYSFLAGVMTVSRITGNRARKVIVTVAVSEADSIFPDDERTAEKLARFRPENVLVVPAAGSGTFPYVMLWCDKNGKRYALRMQLIEGSLKIVKTYNRAALSN